MTRVHRKPVRSHGKVGGRSTEHRIKRKERSIGLAAKAKHSGGPLRKLGKLHSALGTLLQKGVARKDFLPKLQELHSDFDRVLEHMKKGDAKEGSRKANKRDKLRSESVKRPKTPKYEEYESTTDESDEDENSSGAETVRPHAIGSGDEVSEDESEDDTDQETEEDTKEDTTEDTEEDTDTETGTDDTDDTESDATAGNMAPRAPRPRGRSVFSRPGSWR